jgi:hypothetical protein
VDSPSAGTGGVSLSAKAGVTSKALSAKAKKDVAAKIRMVFKAKVAI